MAGRFLYKILGPVPVQTIRASSLSLACSDSAALTLPTPKTGRWAKADSDDGFVHLTTAGQLPITIAKWFADVEVGDTVTIVRLLRDRLTSWKRVEWADAKGREQRDVGPNAHLYGAEIEQSDLSPDPVRQIVRAESSGEKPWARELAEIKDWLIE